MNSPTMEATQWVEIDVQHPIATEQIMHKETTIPSNMHQVTTQISSQYQATSIHNGGNDDEVVSTQ